MKISEQGWHYRLMKWVGITDPRDRTNLCSYIRGILFTIIISMVLILSSIISLVALILDLEPSMWYFKPIIVVAVVITIFEVAVLAVVVSSISSDYYSQNIKHVLFPNKIKRKEPNIFLEWLKAKKQKICPIREFTSEKPGEY